MIDSGILRPLLRAVSVSTSTSHPSVHHLDVQCQCAGVLANLSEHDLNKIKMVEEGVTKALVLLAPSDHDEVQQDVARALANCASSEVNHETMYTQKALPCAIALTKSREEICQRYAAMALRFLASNASVRIKIVEDNLLEPFLILARSTALDYQRTAASALSSFSMSEQNKQRLVRQGGLTQILASLSTNSQDLEVKRDLMFALSNIADSVEYHQDIVREGGVEVLVKEGAHDDARVQRDASRAMASLAMLVDIQPILIDRGFLRTCFHLMQSMDIASQRHATLCLCNLASGPRENKMRMLVEGAVRPLMRMAQYPDEAIRRYASLALAGLALGDVGTSRSKAESFTSSSSSKSSSKLKMVEDGAVRPLVAILKSIDAETKQCAVLALSALALGTNQIPKTAVMTDQGLALLLNFLCQASEIEALRSTLFCLGSLAEQDEVKSKLIDCGLLPQLMALSRGAQQHDVELMRHAGYLFCLLSENIETHDDFVREGGMDAIIKLAKLEDQECQEYATFSLAHLASNRLYQVPLVERGVLRPLISMMSADAEPCHYAGLALLKLAENYANHVRIAEEGGVQALLKLVRNNSTDSELNHKAALSLGTLSANAVDKLSKQQQRGGSHISRSSGNSSIGAGAAQMAKMSNSNLAARHAKEHTTSYLNDKLTQQRNK